MFSAVNSAAKMQLPRGRVGLMGGRAQWRISLSYIWAVIFAIYIIAFVQNDGNFVAAKKVSENKKKI